jgi:hypothetical protein
MKETLSAEAGAPEEGPQETDLVTHQALNERLELFERGFKSRLEIVRRQNEEADRKATVNSAIREFKRELESAGLERERAESSKKLDRSMQSWQNRRERMANSACRSTVVIRSGPS